MMNQEQYAASVSDKPLSEAGGFGAVAKATPLRLLAEEPPNTTNVEDSIKRVRDNDAALTELNWNNIRVFLSCSFSTL